MINIYNDRVTYTHSQLLAKCWLAGQRELNDNNTIQNALLARVNTVHDVNVLKYDSAATFFPSHFNSIAFKYIHKQNINLFFYTLKLASRFLIIVAYTVISCQLINI